MCHNFNTVRIYTESLSNFNFTVYCFLYIGFLLDFVIFCIIYCFVYICFFLIRLYCKLFETTSSNEAIRIWVPSILVDILYCTGVWDFRFCRNSCFTIVANCYWSLRFFASKYMCLSHLGGRGFAQTGCEKL